MKKNIIARLAFLLVAVMLFPACGETYIEENQNAYSAQDIVPLILGTSGPSLVLQTFVYDFKVTYDRSGSEWHWSSSDATIQSVSSDTRTATILFDQLPASGTAVIKVTETTSGGVTSPEKNIEVTVKRFCPLPNGAGSLVGTWTGDDAFYEDVTIIGTSSSATVLNLAGLSEEFISDWWGETVIDGGTVAVTVNNDGTLSIPRQYIYTTEWDGDPYDYEIEGTGLYDFCPADPIITLTYDIYYAGDDVGLAETYAANLGADHMSSELVLSGKKGTVKSFTALPPRPSKK